MSDDAGETGQPDGTGEPVADRTLSWWPLLAALVVGAVILTIVFVVGTDGDSGPGTKRNADGALTCPSDYQQSQKTFWVPSSPSGVDGGESLAPDARPSHVTICSYRTDTPSGTRQVALTGSRSLTDGQRALGTYLATLPEANVRGTFEFDEPKTHYLLGLTYATGYVWISVPGSDVGASNGQFETDKSLGARVGAAYASRVWR